MAFSSKQESNNNFNTFIRIDTSQQRLGMVAAVLPEVETESDKDEENTPLQL